jgi:hypothetical protein
VIKAKLKFRPYPHGRNRWHKTTGTWFYEVRANVRGQSMVVFTDGTGGTATQIPAGLFEQAWGDAGLATRLEQSGHRFSRSWAELVDGADK